jgi:hypothetical protein
MTVITEPTTVDDPTEAAPIPTTPWTDQPTEVRADFGRLLAQAWTKAPLIP